LPIDEMTVILEVPGNNAGDTGGVETEEPEECYVINCFNKS